MNESRELEIGISYKCNNFCAFCLNKEKRGIKENYNLTKKIVIDFAEKGGQKLIITGGEALISKNLFNLLDFSKRKGIIFFEIQTNGRTLYCEDLVKKLKKFEPMSFLVSFQFPNDKLYKKYCQSDGFYQVAEGLKNLIKYNCNFLTNTVVMKPNLYHLEDMIKTLKGIGISYGVQYRFIDGKNVFNNYKKFVPRYKECVPILEKIIKENKEIKIFLKEFPPCVLRKEIRDNVVRPLNFKRILLSTHGKKTLGKEAINQQFTFPNCKNCIYREQKCCGVRKEYVKIYGIGDFNPIIK